MVDPGLIEDLEVPLQLGGGFKYFLFSPLPGEDSHVDEYFSKGLKPPTRQLFGEDEDFFSRAGRISLRQSEV